MPRNHGKGGKNFRRGAKHRDGDGRGELMIKDCTEGLQVYGRVVKNDGGCHFTAACSDSVERKLMLPGKFEKRVWINVGDIVLVFVLDFKPGWGQIIFKYSREEARELVAKGEISRSFLSEDSTAEDARRDAREDGDEGDLGRPAGAAGGGGGGAARPAAEVAAFEFSIDDI